ncbi:hypothetical protein LOY95_003363 [Ophidiomyces ophidiicola]|nr:hypothetical protein LOY95_003363 [Ophidiomyces ophidiicola]
MDGGGGVFGAVGAVLGYIGAEAATELWFAALLWPQRSLAFVPVSALPALALLLPMGGPLHKAALDAADRVAAHGLLGGARDGRMLGTPFFPCTPWTYTRAGESPPNPRAVRNALWVSALRQLPLPALPAPASASAPAATPATAELGLPPSTTPAHAHPPRATVAVYHLVFAWAAPHDRACPRLPFVAEACARPRAATFGAIVAAELSAVAVCAAVLARARSLWGLLFLAPLALRLLSAACALHRDPLVAPTPSPDAPHAPHAPEPAADFVIACPETAGAFMLFSGPPALVQQFFRHYAHPVRCRPRELLQLAIVALFAALFPIGLFCSVLWMPAPVQYTWTCYQLYIVLAMHLVRYTTYARATTTEAHLARCWSRDPVLLFGHARDSPATIKLSLTATYHARYQDAKDCLHRPLSRTPDVKPAPPS